MAIAVITGASSGLGREFAIQIAKRYQKIDEIWLLARSEEKLKETADLLLESGKKVYVYSIDLTKKKQIKKFIHLLKSQKKQVAMLVNAAGFGMIGDFLELSVKENCEMIRLNCEALTYITYEILPYMIKNGKIVNVASSAAFLPQPGFGVYAATKAYVLSFSEFLNQELMKRGITVTAVCPGPVKTAFFDRACKYHSVKGYKKLFMAKPEAVVHQALVDVYHKKTVSVYGMSMKMVRMITKVVSNRLLLKLIKWNVK